MSLDFLFLGFLEVGNEVVPYAVSRRQEPVTEIISKSPRKM